jgi:uncharacterized cupin superfamily protein
MWENDLNTYFSKEEIQVANKHEKVHNIAIKKNQIKTTLRYHLNPVKMAIYKKTKNTFQWGYDEKELIHY